MPEPAGGERVGRDPKLGGYQFGGLAVYSLRFAVSRREQTGELGPMRLIGPNCLCSVEHWRAVLLNA